MHALQDEITAGLLSAYGKPYTPRQGTIDPSIDTKTAVREQVNALDGPNVSGTRSRRMPTARAVGSGMLALSTRAEASGGR